MSVKRPSQIVDVRSASLEGEWHVWDAENRLIEIVTRVDLGTEDDEYDDDDVRVQFKYDHMGRRVEKTYQVYSSGWVTQTGYPERYICDAWNVVMVLDGGDSNDVDRKYTWGLDLSGQAGNATASGIHGAGGIGGLLSAWDDTSGSAKLYWYFYDGNGNVVQVLEYDDTNDTLNTTPVAHYEYDPYGRLITSTGGYKDDNPFRFSTKWLDDELATASQTGAIGEEGLYYYGYRYYSPRLGRWIIRDPVEEQGGVNLYRLGSNSPITGFDSLGLFFFFGCSKEPDPPPPPPPPPRDCSDCWKTCQDNQNLLLGVGGGVLCRADGCQCACLGSGAPQNNGDPANQARRKCMLEHEECHVGSPRTKCDCPNGYPCRQRHAAGGSTQKDEECDCSAVEINCLCNEKVNCGGNQACLKAIDDRIKQMEDFCLKQPSGGGDVYKHGAKRCP